MPALLTHLTLARQLLEGDDPRGALASAAAAEPDALLLGSILPDLPYHARMPVQVALHLAGRGYLDSEWGHLFHTRNTGQLALALLQHVRREQLGGRNQRRVLALAAGYVSHYTLDRVVHPAINRVVARLRADSGTDEPVVRTHERLERLQSLFYHQELLGYLPPCTPYGRRLTSQVAGTRLLWPTLDEPLSSAVHAAVLQTHGRTPADSTMRDWLRGVALYGHLLSSHMARTEIPRGDLDQLRRQRYDGPGIDLRQPLERAQRATRSAWSACEQLLAVDQIGTEQQHTFLAQLPDVDLALGD